jgi:membrane protease YdiL (CAAX protease family)
MSTAPTPLISLRSLIARRSVSAYFLLCFVISWAGALGVALPWIVKGTALPTLTGILMFPVMLVGPVVAGIGLTTLLNGRSGLRELVARLRRWRFPGRWYSTLLIPPALVLAVLLGLTWLDSRVFAPNLFLVGILFGIPAGFLEEIGWTGFAFPELHETRSALSSAVLLGVLWVIWHAPVIDFLGAAHPHQQYWLPFFLAFGLAMTAIRVLISWVYVNTRSLFAAQLLHVSSTGSLVVFGAPTLTPAQEATWYATYGLALWLCVAVIVRLSGPDLSLSKQRP